MNGHDHQCWCGGTETPHETGAKGCFRFMTDNPLERPGGRWFADGTEITDFTLREQRGYHAHPCGCWSRWEGSHNSIQ